MNGFLTFIFIIFFVVPILKNIFGGGAKTGKKASKYGQSHAQIKKQIQNHGHSGVKKQTHNRMHSNDGSSVFPADHQNRVQARDIRDTQKFKTMEKTMHSRKNRGVVKTGNKSRADWGARGDKEFFSLSNVLKLIVLVAIAYAVAHRFFPEILSALR